VRLGATAPTVGEVRTEIDGAGRAPVQWHQAEAAPLRALLECVAWLAARLSALVGRAPEIERPHGTAVATAAPTTRPGDPRHRLTPRERQVLGLIADGLSSKEIARSLGIARATARCHVQNVLTKLGVASRVHAAALVHPTAADRPVAAHRFGTLTRRETEVLRALAAGLGQREIAARLHLSPHTVRTHVQRLLAKLDAHSVLGALALARRAGLTPAEVPACGRPG
jgi:DNA-binding NarL/FixJ family response regulator